MGYRVWRKHDNMFSHFDIIPACDGWMDEQTQARSQGVKPPERFSGKRDWKVWDYISGINAAKCSKMQQNASFQHQNPTNYSLLQNVLWYCLYSFICTKFSKLILRKIIKNCCQKTSDFKSKMHQIRCRLGLRPIDPAGVAYSVPPDPLAGSKGPYF